jgi:serine/threonine protein kinase
LDNAFRYEKTVSSKSDVWAFGLMIWEIFTQKKAWKDLLDEIQWNAKLFSEELCDRARLPEMEKSIPPHIVPIIVSCLKTNGDDRPSFSQLVDRLISAQIEYFLHKDEVAIAFWKNHWIKNNWDSNNKVSWDKFQDALKSFLKMTENSDVDVWNTLKAR